MAPTIPPFSGQDPEEDENRIWSPHGDDARPLRQPGAARAVTETSAEKPARAVTETSAEKPARAATETSADKPAQAVTVTSASKPERAETSPQGPGHTSSQAAAAEKLPTTSERTPVPAPERLSSMLRAERIACRAYERLLSHLPPTEYKVRLEQIHREHAEAVKVLREQLGTEAGDVDEEGQDTLSVLTQGTGTVLHDPTALKALRTCEEESELDYENALADSETHPELRDLIRSRLLPRIRRHLPVLDELIRAA